MAKAHHPFKPLANFLKIASLSACLASPSFAQDNAEIVFWQTVSESGSVAQLQAYIDAFPEGIYRTLAEIQIKEIQGAAVKETIASNAQAQEDCDRLAGHAGDETLTVAPTSLRDLMGHTQAAIEACSIAQQTSDNPRYAFQLGRAYWASGDAINAWNWYLHASLSGHQRATYRMGLTYYNGNEGVTQDVPKIPVDIDHTKALEKFQENADRGHIGSAYYAGWILATGEATGTSDFEAAYPYFEQVDQSGATDANFALGYMYENGLEVSYSLDTAIEYYERALATQSRDWDSARARLANLMLYRYDNSNYHNIGNASDYLNEILDLFAAMRTQSDVVTHDNYVFLITREIADISSSVANTSYEFNRNPDTARAEDMSLIDSLYYRLEPAMIARHDAFPDLYPEQTSWKSNELASALLQAGKTAIYESYKLGDFVEYASETEAKDCVIVNFDTDEDYLATNVYNGCRFDVDFQLQHSIDYSSSSYYDQFEPFAVNLTPGEYRDFTTYRDEQAAGQYNAVWMACYILEGYENMDWDGGYYDCGKFARHSYESYQVLEDEIDRLKEEIFGHPFN